MFGVHKSTLVGVNPLKQFKRIPNFNHTTSRYQHFDNSGLSVHIISDVFLAHLRIQPKCYYSLNYFCFPDQLFK